MQELEEKILNATIDEFASKGLRLTMDDIAKNLHISKKTVYSIYENKEALFLAVADYCFADIKEHERRVAEDQSLGVIEKLKKIMIVMPDRYQNIGLSNLYQLKDKFPSVYKKVEKYLDTDWDATIKLLEQGMEEGLIRPISIPLFQTIFESTIQGFMASSVLVDNNISYEQALGDVIDILLNGILI